jgi:hypothetical protein
MAGVNSVAAGIRELTPLLTFLSTLALTRLPQIAGSGRLMNRGPDQLRGNFDKTRIAG